ncbi:hypothetical protein BJ165DRAFT_203238 [Panaeolus papilionaceus]|nr:hypothetical protein BJ165DRAFT_203238 [Panaeolus papilionaceus]
MHQALRQPELLTQIFEWLSVPTIDDPVRAQRWGINRKACLTAAPTCRLFLSAALDVIWKTLPELTPLIALIPGLKIFSIADKPILASHNPFCYFVRTPSPIDSLMTVFALINHHMEVVKEYAKRVKHLTIPESTTHDPQVHPSVLALSTPC